MLYGLLQTRVRQLSRKTFLALTATYATSKTKRGIPELKYGRYVYIFYDMGVVGSKTQSFTSFMTKKIRRKSKHLKGQLDPPVGNGNVFAPMEVSWDPVFVT